MWHTWKDAPTEENLYPLIQEFRPDIEYKVSEFASAPVPDAAVRSKARILTIKALNTYSPDKGAGVRTWVNWNLRKVRAFAIENQNFGRIPEGRALKIAEFKQVKSDLTQKMGFPPDALTLSEALGPKWSVAEVTRMETELRSDLVESMSLESDQLPTLFESKERDILRYIYHDLTAQERSVYEYTLGVNGKPKLSAKDIAAKMNISGPKVSRLRKSIDQKMRKRGLK